MSTNFFTNLKNAGKRKESVVEYEGNEFTLRDMSGAMRDAYDADIKKRVKFKGIHPDMNTLDTKGQRAILVAMTLVNTETDELAFDYAKDEDITTLSELSGTLLDTLFDAAQALCGLAGNSEDDAEKN